MSNNINVSETPVNPTAEGQVTEIGVNIKLSHGVVAVAGKLGSEALGRVFDFKEASAKRANDMIMALAEGASNWTDHFVQREEGRRNQAEAWAHEAQLAAAEANAKREAAKEREAYERRTREHKADLARAAEERRVRFEQRIREEERAAEQARAAARKG